MCRLFDVILGLMWLVLVAAGGAGLLLFFRVYGFHPLALMLSGLCLFAAFRCLRLIVRGI